MQFLFQWFLQQASRRRGQHDQRRNLLMLHKIRL
jgi:hypothetical protein